MSRSFSPQYLDSKPLPKPNLSPRPNNRRTLSSISRSREVSGNSSLWAEDYFDSATDVGTIDTNIGPVTPPPAATTTARPFPRSIPISEHEEAGTPRQPRTHQRSLTALLPSFRIPGRSPEQSPKREKTHIEVDEGFMPTLTGDREGVVKLEDRRGGLSGWFSGSSAPVTMGISSGEREDSPSNMSPDTSPERSTNRLQKRPVLQTTGSTLVTPSKTPASGTSLFNLFSSPKSQPAQTIQLPQDVLQNDELLTLDINTALFPSGPVDPFSPSAFKNLQVNAEGTLLKLQTGYKLRTLSLHELQAEKSAQEDELEEAETRAAVFKTQYEDMVRRVAEQDKVIEDLVRELAQEKQARAEEKAAREKSIALVKANALKMSKRTSCCENHGEEDLGITNADGKKWRQSGDSTQFSESDTESQTGDSVFSRAWSPKLAGATSSAASLMTTESSPEILQATMGRVVANTNQSARPKMLQQPSTFQKMLGVGKEAPKEELRGMGLEPGCKNCQGKEASVAWDAVGLMRAENKGLKDRVGELETAVEETLDFCAGLRL